MKNQAGQFFKKLQNEITHTLNDLNQKPYRQDFWERKGGGGGDTRVYEDGGALLEKGGVNFSEVHGEFPAEFAKTLPHGDGTKFYATGVSLVLHPRNPFAPTVHANFRYIERGNTGWFGGGADLTPCYVFEEDARHFHKTYYEALKPFGPHLYAKFKKACDEYFYLPHRGETRGVGGIFFDYQINTEEFAKGNEITGSIFDMVASCGSSFLESYIPIVKKRMNTPFEIHNKEFQEIRRGRYVEFNLLYDRGTVFGLKTNGRTESILMSLPLKAQWHYDYKAEPGTQEAKLNEYLKPINWLGLGSVD